MSRNNHSPGLALRVSLFHIHALDGRVHLKKKCIYIKASLLLEMNIILEALSSEVIRSAQGHQLPMKLHNKP